MNRGIILFAKDPQLNNVKTRLQKTLSAEQVLYLYQSFIKDMIKLLQQLDCERRFIAFHSEDNKNRKPVFLKKFVRGFSLFKQEGQDLGKKMYYAFRYVASQKISHMILIGSDLPNLPPTHIKNAFQALTDHDVVLGPSLDGGYYLIALKNPDLRLFENIQWGTEQVFIQTVKKIRLLNKTVSILNPWYDVDNLEQLRRLKIDLSNEPDPHIAQFTRKSLNTDIGRHLIK